MIISGHLGLQVTVTNKSGLLYSLTIAIESWYSCYIFYWDLVKDDAKIIFLLIFSIVVLLESTIFYKSK